MFKIIIAGGRDFEDYGALESYCKHILQNQSNIEIVSGTAKGADELGERFAIENNLALKSFPAPWHEIENKPKNQIGVNSSGKKYWKRAGAVRNKQMAKYADALIAFHDGESKGTANMIEEAKKNKLRIRVKEY